jgi:hypothetical protein
MTTYIRPLLVLAVCLTATFAYAESPALSTATGTVEKAEKEMVAIHTGERPGKTLKLKITGTSKFTMLLPLVRDGKTVLTQRTAEASDLAAGQSIAVIYTLADKETVLLHAVFKALDEKK